MKIELGNICDSCAIDWIKIYTIHYQLVVPKMCEECDGESEE
jgi:hypothetical protein